MSKQTLLPKTIERRIPALYATESESDPTVYVKWFTPDSSFSWYATEYSAVAPDGTERLAFGLIENEYGQELGYIHLVELEQVRGKYGLPVERDRYFRPCKLSEIRGN